MNTDFYNASIVPYVGIIIKICRAYTYNQADFEDYYQEVCLQIWRSSSQFKEQSQWSTWIYRLSLNVCMTLFKKTKKNKYIVSEYTSHTDTENTGLADRAIEDRCPFEDDSLNQLYDAIRQLSEVDRGIILLYLEEQSYQQIANIMGTNPNNIGVRIKRIKSRLRKILDEQFN